MPSTQSNLAPAFRKTTETFSAGAKSLAQRYFVSPEIFAQEQRKIFSEQWILVGHQSQIPKAGDYFVAEVAGGKRSRIDNGAGGNRATFTGSAER
jgi:hypothetical protein